MVHTPTVRRQERHAGDHIALVCGLSADPTVVAVLLDLLDRMPDIAPTVEAVGLVQRLQAERSRAQATMRLSLAHDDELEVIGPGATCGRSSGRLCATT